ncbi:MAG: type II secretion system protein GspM [Novosphingobium sp.]
MRSLSRRESRLVAVLLLLLAVTLIYFGLVAPVVDGFQNRALLREQLHRQFRSNEQRIATLDALQREALRQQDALRTMFLIGADADEAGEALRAEIEAAAQTNGADIKATEALLSSEEGWTRAALEARMTHSQFAALLAQLNQLHPPVVVDTVIANAADALNDPKSDTLNVRLEISAPFLRAQ